MIPSSTLLVLLSILVLATARDVRDNSLDPQPRRPPTSGQPLKLVKIALIHRHGNRSPGAAPYPTDPYPANDSSIWPDGPGQLTIEGKRRMLHLGRFLRQRYANFLSHEPTDVYARSSPIERCMSSAQLVLTGAYPPTGRLQIEEGLNWQPVPIHMREKPMDRMLMEPNPKCSKSEAIQKQNLKRISQEYLKRHADHLPYIEQATGLNITHVLDVQILWDNLISAKYAGLRLPDWAYPALMSRMQKISEVSSCIASSGKTTPRLIAGVFLHDLKKFFESAEPNLVEGMPRKAFFYSTHNSRVVALLYALDIFDGRMVEYGVTVLFELLQSPENGQLFVRTIFLPDVLEAGKGELRPSVTRGCPMSPGVECTTEEFFEGLKDYIIDPETQAKECAEIPEEVEQLVCPL